MLNKKALTFNNIITNHLAMPYTPSDLAHRITQVLTKTNAVNEELNNDRETERHILMYNVIMYVKE